MNQAKQETVEVIAEVAVGAYRVITLMTPDGWFVVRTHATSPLRCHVNWCRDEEQALDVTQFEAGWAHFEQGKDGIPEWAGDAFRRGFDAAGRDAYMQACWQEHRAIEDDIVEEKRNGWML